MIGGVEQSEREAIAAAAVGVASAQLRLVRTPTRDRIDIVWYGGPIVRKDDGRIVPGGHNADTDPNRIHLSLVLDSPADITEVTRHEIGHIAGLSERQCGYFAVGVLPKWVNGRPVLPEGDTLAAHEWPRELSPEILRNAPPGRGLIASKWGDD